MGEKIYYISQVLIFSAMGIMALLNPEFVAKNILKSDTNMMMVISRILGIVAIVNAIRCFNGLLK